MAPVRVVVRSRVDIVVVAVHAVEEVPVFRPGLDARHSFVSSAERPTHMSRKPVRSASPIHWVLPSSPSSSA